MSIKLTPEVLSDWERKHRRRLRITAILGPIAGFLMGMVLIFWVNYMFNNPVPPNVGVNGTITNAQTGFMNSIAKDPTQPPGVSGRVWQLLIRTDTPVIYVKTGTANTAWTMLGCRTTIAAATDNNDCMIALPEN